MMKKNEKKSVSFGVKLLASFLALLMILGTVFMVLSFVLG